jgi:lambda repressor-like predicted transcriptional regulator
MTNEETLRAILKSQYHAALAMLKEALERCPEEVWFSQAHVNRFWQIAYHTLYFTHLYLQPNEAAVGL